MSRGKTKGYWVSSYMLSVIAESAGWGGVKPNKERFEQLMFFMKPKKRRNSWLYRLFPWF